MVTALVPMLPGPVVLGPSVSGLLDLSFKRHGVLGEGILLVTMVDLRPRSPCRFRRVGIEAVNLVRILASASS